MKEILVDDNLKKICHVIAQEGKSLEEWSEVESDDMFQIGNIVGGFDATENEFCFSIFIEDHEYWFQISLSEVNDIIKENLKLIKLRKAD